MRFPAAGPMDDAGLLRPLLLPPAPIELPGLIFGDIIESGLDPLLPPPGIIITLMPFSPRGVAGLFGSIIDFRQDSSTFRFRVPT